MNAIVNLWGTTIGTLSEEDGKVTFEYDKSFLRSGIEICPLMMPASENIYSFPELSYQSFFGLPGIFADSLPDKFGNAIIAAWAEKNGRSADSLTSIERLCYTGTRGMGALEYVPELPIHADKSIMLEVDELASLASKILEKRKSISTSLDDSSMEQIISVGTSAGGARAKAVIAINEKNGSIKSGQINAGPDYNYWLIKFDNIKNNRDKEDVDDHEYTRIEYAYYLMARDAGIDMMESRLLERDDSFHFITKRFDRTNEGDKLHMLSLAGMAHYDFNIAGEHSYEDVAVVLRKLNVDHSAFVQLFKRMAFNALAMNHDDHVKNISFLMDRTGKWALSPAYDITYAYNPGGAWTGSHQMRINGKRKMITHEDLIMAGKTIGLSVSEINDSLIDIKESMEKWPTHANQAKLSGRNIERIGRVISLN